MANKEFLLIWIIVVSLGEISMSRSIKTLTQGNMAAFQKDNSYWLIQVSEGKCPNCAAQEDALEETSNLLDGVVKVGKIDAALIPNIKISSNPTYIFTRSDDPTNSVQYEGKITKTELSKFCIQELTNYIKVREKKIDSKPSAKANKQQKKQTTSHPSSSSSTTSPRSSTVIQLSDSLFEEKVLKSKEAWLVQFYSTGCGHCKNFEPEYSKLPKLIGKRVHIARLEGNQNKQQLSKYQIKGFPTVLLFDTKSKDKPIPYEGERTADALSAWLKGQNINEEKKQILQLSEATYKEECNRNIICFIFILEKLSDKSRLTFLKTILQEQAERPIKFFISTRLPDFESQLMIDDRSCPKLISVWDSISSYRIFNGELTEDGVNQFLKSIMDRKKWIKLSTSPAKALFTGNNEL